MGIDLLVRNYKLDSLHFHLERFKINNNKFEEKILCYARIQINYKKLINTLLSATLTAKRQNHYFQQYGYGSLFCTAFDAVIQYLFAYRTKISMIIVYFNRRQDSTIIWKGDLRDTSIIDSLSIESFEQQWSHDKDKFNSRNSFEQFDVQFMILGKFCDINHVLGFFLASGTWIAIIFTQKE